jgi:hypothetical protein
MNCMSKLVATSQLKDWINNESNNGIFWVVLGNMFANCSIYNFATIADTHSTSLFYWLNSIFDCVTYAKIR